VLLLKHVKPSSPIASNCFCELRLARIAPALLAALFAGLTGGCIIGSNFALPAAAAPARWTGPLAGGVSGRSDHLLLALWDGEPSQGLGGTADVVAFARGLGRPVVWLHSTTGEVRLFNEKTELNRHADSDLSRSSTASNKPADWVKSRRA